MKHTLTITLFLTAIFLSTSFVSANNTEEQLPVDEIIACEIQQSCQMTPIETLIKK